MEQFILAYKLNRLLDCIKNTHQLVQLRLEILETIDLAFTVWEESANLIPYCVRALSKKILLDVVPVNHEATIIDLKTIIN